MINVVRFDINVVRCPAIKLRTTIGISYIETCKEICTILRRTDISYTYTEKNRYNYICTFPAPSEKHKKHPALLLGISLVFNVVRIDRNVVLLIKLRTTIGISYIET